MNRTIVVGDDPSWGVLQTYLPLYLEPDGSVRRELGGLQPLYEFLCEVAAMGTRKAAGKRPGGEALGSVEAESPAEGRHEDEIGGASGNGL